MHPKEYKEEKSATGRFTHLCLKNSEIHMGIDFDSHKAVQEQINDIRNFPMLLYPGKDAINLSEGVVPGGILHDRQLLVILIDATWRNAQKDVQQKSYTAKVAPTGDRARGQEPLSH